MSKIMDSMTATLIECLKRNPALLKMYRDGYAIYFENNPFTKPGFAREVCDSLRNHAPEIEAPYWQFMCYGMNAVNWYTVADFVIYGMIRDPETGELIDVPVYDSSEYDEEDE